MPLKIQLDPLHPDGFTSQNDDDQPPIDRNAYVHVATTCNIYRYTTKKELDYKEGMICRANLVQYQTIGTIMSLYISILHMYKSSLFTKHVRIWRFNTN